MTGSPRSVKRALTGRTGARPGKRAIRAALAKVLGSETFANVREKRLGGLLTYLVGLSLTDAPKAAFSGNAIAVDFIYAGNAAAIAAFDPKTNRIVAANLNHLKDRLRRYYLVEGEDDEVKIGFGDTHEPVFSKPSDVTAEPLDLAIKHELLRALTALDAHTWRGDLRALRYTGTVIEIRHPTVLATASLVFVGAMPRLPGLARLGLDKLEAALPELHAAGAGHWEPVFAQGCLRAAKYHDWRGATRLMAVAHRASHGASVYYWWHTALLACRGKTDQAIVILAQAVEHFARTNVGIRCDLAMLQIMAGRFGEAAAMLVSTLDLAGSDQSIPTAHLALLHEAADDVENAWPLMQAYLRKAFDSESRTDDVDFRPDVHHLSFPVAGFIAGRMGATGIATAIMETMIAERAAGKVAFGAAQMAMVATGLGQFGAAVEWLRVAAFEECEPLAMWFHLWPPFRHLQTEPSFMDLLKSLKLIRR